MWKKEKIEVANSVRASETGEDSVILIGFVFRFSGWVRWLTVEKRRSTRELQKSVGAGGCCSGPSISARLLLSFRTPVNNTGIMEDISLEEVCPLNSTQLY